MSAALVRVTVILLGKDPCLQLGRGRALGVKRREALGVPNGFGRGNERVSDREFSDG